MNTSIPDSVDNQVLDLRAIFLVLWSKRWWIVLSTALFTVGFIAAAFLITPVYRSSAVLVPAAADRSSGLMGSAISQLGGLASLAGISVGSNNSEVEEALAVLRSRQFTESFINDNNLLPKLFSDDWDIANKRWRVSEEDQPTPAKAYQYFNKKIRSIIQDKKTGLVTLQIDWKNRQEAADWANQLVERINVEMRKRAIDNADAALGFLEKELKVTSLVPTQEAVNRLIEAQIKQRMLANVTKEYAFRVVDRAMVADIKDVVWPARYFLIISGAVVGLLVGIFCVLLACSLGASKDKC